MTRKLTQKQERFTQNLFGGMSQREAYIVAGYSSKQAPATIDRNACILANSNKIVTRWNDLRQKAEDESVLIVLERKQRLTEFAREDNPTQFGFNRQGNIHAIDLLNKMDGAYAPEKHEHLGLILTGELTDAQLIAIAKNGDKPRHGGNGASEEAPSS